MTTEQIVAITLLWNAGRSFGEIMAQVPDTALNQVREVTDAVEQVEEEYFIP